LSDASVAGIAVDAVATPSQEIAARRWVVPALLLAGLGVVVAARAWAIRAGLDPLAIGAVFGLALWALVLRGSAPWRIPSMRSVIGSLAIGAAFGLVLVALGAAGAAIGGLALVPGLGRPAAPFVPWVAITVVVASAEEALLRGRLFDAVQHAGGVVAAVIVTTAAFALMHVPLYGWHVVPLDLAVGVALGGLRLATRNVVAPTAAHAVADLATWWL
jgi:membrane protease YdiL (CAAX protease family)